MSAKDFDRPRSIKRQDELDDFTTCCICSGLYTDPKTLPCMHTFCISCLLDTGLNSNKGPGDQMPCPTCRGLFKIPPEGFHGLPKNLFIERLIQFSRFTDQSTKPVVLCSLCFEESREQEGKNTPTADAYCIICKHKLCKDCCFEHREFKATKYHNLLPLSECESDQNVIIDLAPIACEVHGEKYVDVYCANCKEVVCAICFIEEHKNHEGSHVNKCMNGFRNEIENNTETMNECIAQALTKKAELFAVKEQMQNLMESLEYDIESRKEQVKQFAEKHASSLVQGLVVERQSRLKEFQMVKDDIDEYISKLESYNSYSKHIITKGSASDICSALSSLSGRATELQHDCQPIIERVIQECEFCFRQFELEELLKHDGGNLIGKIESKYM